MWNGTVLLILSPSTLLAGKYKKNLQNIYKSSSAKDLLQHRFSWKIRENQDFEIEEALIIVKLKYKQDENWKHLR